jgi:hypothetical protein
VGEFEVAIPGGIWVAIGVLGEAAIVCGVSMTTMIRWTKEGTLKRKQSTMRIPAIVTADSGRS